MLMANGSTKISLEFGMKQQHCESLGSHKKEPPFGVNMEDFPKEKSFSDLRTAGSKIWSYLKLNNGPAFAIYFKLKSRRKT